MRKEWGQRLSKYFLIPQRVISAIMGFWAVTIAYTLRSSLSLAITEMVAKPEGSEYQPECIDEEEKQKLFREMNSDGKFVWSEETQGLILSAFYFGYIFTHIPGGLLAAKYGSKTTLLAGISFATFITLITPVAVEAGDATVMIILRVLIGVGQGVVYPACNVLLTSWTPLSERGILSTLVYSGGQIGSIIGSVFSGLLLSAYTWHSVFYFFGIVAFVWCICFYLLCYSNPESNPFISEKEQTYLLKELGELKRDENVPPTPWKHILTSAPIWALIVAQIGHNWGFFIMVSDLPKYLSDVLNYSVKSNGLVTALPYAVMWIVALATGLLSDFIISKKYLSIKNTRKLFTITSTIGPGLFLVGAAYSGCERIAVVALFTIGMGFMGTFYSGHKANNLDLAPNYAGVIMALSNGIGAFSGMVGPTIVGVITTNRRMSEWQIVFWITLAVFVVTTLVFLIWSSGDVQYWNNLKPVSSPENGAKIEKFNEHYPKIDDDSKTDKKTDEKY